MSLSPLDALSSPQGALSLAVAVLAAVLGVRLLAPRSAAGWAAALAYVASLAASWLGASGLVPGGARPGVSAPMTVRLAGGALLVFGLLAAGRAAREAAGRAEGAVAGRAEGSPRGAQVKVLGGLAMVLAGQVVRAPSPAGVAVLAMAAAVLGWAALRG
jgi:hypothetical protein